MTEAGSIVVRRQLGRELRTWRERSRRTLDDVAAAPVASVSKVQRIEHGRTSVRPGDVRELCRLYGVNDETTQALADMARATRDPDWWERLADPDEAWSSAMSPRGCSVSRTCSNELIRSVYGSSSARALSSPRSDPRSSWPSSARTSLRSQGAVTPMCGCSNSLSDSTRDCAGRSRYSASRSQTIRPSSTSRPTKPRVTLRLPPR